MAAFRCTTVRGWRFTVSGVLIYYCYYIICDDICWRLYHCIKTPSFIIVSLSCFLDYCFTGKLYSELKNAWLQVPLLRRVIKQGVTGMCKVEVYLVDLNLCHLEQSVVQHFSHVDTLGKFSYFQVVVMLSKLHCMAGMACRVVNNDTCLTK